MAGTMPGLYAQVQPEPFGEFELSFSLQANINENLLHDFWDPSPGISGSVGLPFYLGTVELNAGYHFFEGKTTDVPDIDRLQVSLGWVNRVKPAPRLRVGGGISLVGSVLFFKNIPEAERIRARDFYGSSSPETEVGIGLQADLTYQFSPSWSIRFNVNRDVTFTSTKMKLTYIGVGIVKSVSLPKPISEVLK